MMLAAFIALGNSPAEFVLLLLLLLIVFFGAAAIALPLSSVAESFEYDMRRSLNNPLLLNRSRRFIGDQMLTYLGSLDWGFRFGGNTINARMTTGVLVAMLSMLVGTFGSKIS